MDLFSTIYRVAVGVEFPFPFPQDFCGNPIWIPYDGLKGLSRSARRSFRRMILSRNVFRSVKIQKNTQFSQYYNVI